MANLTESPIYEPGIFQLEKSTPPLGGAPVIDNGVPSAGHANAQALQLANRTAWLKEQVDNGGSATSLAADLASNSDSEKGAQLIGWDGDTVGAQMDLSKKLKSYAAVRGYSGRATRIEVTKRVIGGIFNLNLFDTTTADNGGTKLRDALGRLWERDTEGVINPAWFGADPTAQTDCSPGFNNAWQAYRAILNVPTTHADENNTPCIFKATPGEYLILNPIDLGVLVSFSAVIDFTGCVFLAKCAGKVAIDALGLRGETWNGGHIIGDSVQTPSVGLLRGPVEHQAIGNSSVNQLKITGYFNLANGINIGHETTTWNDCYFVNYKNSLTSWSYAADSYNRLGVTSEFHTIRPAIEWASMTCNSFYGCRFFKGGLTGGSPIYMEGAFGWYFDPSCYYVSFGNAAFQMRQTGSSYVNSNIDINGLFETFVSFNNSSGGNDPSKGIQSCVQILAENGQDRVFKQLKLNPGQVQCGKSIIDVVDVETRLPLTSGSITLSASSVSVSGTVNRNFVLPLFTGNQIRFSGDIAIGSTGQISFDISVLRYFAGSLKTTSDLNITEPASFANYGYVWTKYGGGPVIRGDLTVGNIKRALDITVGDPGVVSTRTISAMTSGNTKADSQIQFVGGSAAQDQGTIRLLSAVVSTAQVRPNTDNTYPLGAPTYRWSAVYSATPAISTSDGRFKTGIQDIDDIVLDAWSMVEFQQYRFIESVDTKGDAARLHVGVIAQQVKIAFENHGVDPFLYGILCYDQWDELPEVLEFVPEETDIDGEIVKEAKTIVVQEFRAAGDRYSIRYEEALTLEAALMRRTTKRLEARLAELEGNK